MHSRTSNQKIGELERIVSSQRFTDRLTPLQVYITAFEQVFQASFYHAGRETVGPVRRLGDFGIGRRADSRDEVFLQRVSGSYRASSLRPSRIRVPASAPSPAAFIAAATALAATSRE